jgi:hypothetical protein
VYKTGEMGIKSVAFVGVSFLAVVLYHIMQDVVTKEGKLDGE